MLKSRKKRSERQRRRRLTPKDRRLLLYVRDTRRRPDTGRKDFDRLYREGYVAPVRCTDETEEYALTDAGHEAIQQSEAVQRETWYRVRYSACGRIEEVCVEEADEKNVWIDGRRCPKRSAYCRYFEDRDAAVLHVLDTYDAEIRDTAQYLEEIVLTREALFDEEISRLEAEEALRRSLDGKI